LGRSCNDKELFLLLLLLLLLLLYILPVPVPRDSELGVPLQIYD